VSLPSRLTAWSGDCSTRRLSASDDISPQRSLPSAPDTTNFPLRAFSHTFVHFWTGQLCWVFLFRSLTEVFPCFFPRCKASVRVKLANTGHGPHSSKFLCCSVYFLCCSIYFLCCSMYFLCCSMYFCVVPCIFRAVLCIFCVVLCIFVLLCIFCVVLCIVCFVSFSVLFVCICVLYYCHRVATQLQLTNISYHIS
jgi:hypothetical protein